jgi:hypothetical protein
VTVEAARELVEAADRMLLKMRPKRWPVIRHVRYWFLAYRVQKWAWTWGQMGIGLGYPNPSDVKQLDDIWAGRA